MLFTPDDLLKLLLALLAGGLIGAEREFRDKSAGFRTMILICLGAALTTMLSHKLAPDSDPNRIAANIVTGIGFLGAGAILRDGLRITGLTTAATIWLAAAVGMAIGGGYWLLGIATTVAAVLVLVVFPIFEHWIDGMRHTHSYVVHCQLNPELYVELDRLVIASGVKVYARRRTKSGTTMVCTWQTTGRPKCHDVLTTQLLAHPAIEELDM
jgi:putative Mg2+ transporter-C (MgtC) family protein